MDLILQVYKRGKWQVCVKHEDGVFVVETRMLSFLIPSGNNSTKKQRCRKVTKYPRQWRVMSSVSELGPKT